MRALDYEPCAGSLQPAGPHAKHGRCTVCGKVLRVRDDGTVGNHPRQGATKVKAERPAATPVVRSRVEDEAELERIRSLRSTPFTYAEGERVELPKRLCKNGGQHGVVQHSWWNIAQGVEMLTVFRTVDGGHGRSTVLRAEEVTRA